MDINDVDLIDFEDNEPVQPSSFSEPDDVNLDADFVQNNNTEPETPADLTNILDRFKQPEGTGDVLLDYLKYNGIADPSKIKYEDEDGVIKEAAWDNLSYSDKMGILKSVHQEPERDLEDYEIDFINQLRQARLTPEQYVTALRNKAMSDAMSNYQNSQALNIDDFTDDQIFIYDLQDKNEDITDEEAGQALEKFKENPDLFKKHVDGIRKVLKQQLEQLTEQNALLAQQEQQEQFEQFKNSVVDSIQNFNSIGDVDIDLDQNDMEDVASFILDTDDTGMSYFGKALNDPKALVEMAWFALKGRDAFKSITEYYNNEIKNVRQKSYEKGLADGKNGVKLPSKVVITEPSTPVVTTEGGMNYLDLLG